MRTTPRAALAASTLLGLSITAALALSTPASSSEPDPTSKPAEPKPASPATAPTPATAPAQPPKAPSAPAVDPLPTEWLGDWSGPATVSTPGRPPLTFTMGLKVAKTDDPAVYTWTITYTGEQGSQVRPYKLLVKDAAKGRFAIDEQNSIVIDATLLSSGLYSHFVIGEAAITCSYRLHAPNTPDEALIVELLTHNPTKPTSTGNKDGIPEVKSYPPQSLQRATLKRTKPAPAPR